MNDSRASLTYVAPGVQGRRRISLAEPQERVERGDGVLVVVRQRVTRLDTGAVDERRVGHLYTFRDDKAICMRVYADLEQAMRALDV